MLIITITIHPLINKTQRSVNAKYFICIVWFVLSVITHLKRNVFVFVFAGCLKIRLR